MQSSPDRRPVPSEAARRFASLPKLCGRSGGCRRAGSTVPLPAYATSTAAARFAALPRMHGWAYLAPLDDRARRLAEDHLELARAAARRLRRLGDDAESEAVWQVVRLAARWAGDEAGFADAVARRLANVHRRAWMARSVVTPVRGRPAPRVRSLTAPDGRVMDVVDERQGPEIEEIKVAMLFAVTIRLEYGSPVYVGSTGKWVDDPAEARKHSTIADAEVWRLAHVPPADLPLSAVVKVCDGNQFDRSSVVLDRTKTIDVNGHPQTNGAAGMHAGRTT